MFNNKYFWPRHHEIIPIKTLIGVKLRKFTPVNSSTFAVHTCWIMHNLHLVVHILLAIEVSLHQNLLPITKINTIYLDQYIVSNTFIAKLTFGLQSRHSEPEITPTLHESLSLTRCHNLNPFSTFISCQPLYTLAGITFKQVCS